ncbi:hypothetical protein BRARA_C01354 [Brassica rapa]|uniref:Uncharacterized protein n=1 Tax=Brassica campestris TaxID=3711 RepID=A0A398A257_BRACM|nr:hypothetical protein BRARA_C01354 [Brassica rapa]
MLLMNTTNLNAVLTEDLESGSRPLYVIVPPLSNEHHWFDKRRKCGERGSNTRPSDLQSDALPTELSPR